MTTELHISAAKHLLRYGYPIPVDLLVALDDAGIDIEHLEKEVEAEYEHIKLGGTDNGEDEETDYYFP